MKWLFLFTAIVLEVSGSLSLKGAQHLPTLYAVVGVGYLGSFLALSFSLRRGMPLGIGYGVWGASGVVLTAIFSSLLYGEPFTVMMAVGVGVVVVGLLFVNLGAQNRQRKKLSS